MNETIWTQATQNQHLLELIECRVKLADERSRFRFVNNEVLVLPLVDMLLKGRNDTSEHCHLVQAAKVIPHDGRDPFRSRVRWLLRFVEDLTTT